MIMEMRDGVLSEFTMWEFLAFLAFHADIFQVVRLTVSNGLNEDYENIPEKDWASEYVRRKRALLDVWFLYKFILAYVFGSLLLPQLKECALQMGGVFNIATLGVMYAYGFDLFFDFAGYSMFALAISNLMGVKSPVNFNQPLNHVI